MKNIKPRIIHFVFILLFSSYLGAESARVVLVPRQETDLSAEVTSPVIKIHKRLGETFKKGEPLITLDDKVFASIYARSEAAMSLADTRLVAVEQMHRSELASDTQLKEAKAETAKARADYVQAKKQLEATVIKAPYRGKVQDVLIEEHELALERMVVVTTVEDEVLVAKCLIPSKYLAGIGPGDVLPIRIDETGDFVYATVSRMGAMIDPASSTLKIEAIIDNSSGALQAGMVGDLELRMEKAE